MTRTFPGRNRDGKLQLKASSSFILSFFVVLLWPSRKFNTELGEGKKKKVLLEEADFPRERDQSAITANTGNVPGVISGLSRNLCNLFLHQSNRSVVAEESGC